MYNQLNIAYVLNNDFIRPTLVSVYSLLENTNSSEKITFHFFIYEKKTEIEIKKFFKKIDFKIKKLNFILLDEKILMKKAQKSLKKYEELSSQSKFMARNLSATKKRSVSIEAKIEAIIYSKNLFNLLLLDGDTLFVDDIFEMFKFIKTNDNKTIVYGVRDYYFSSFFARKRMINHNPDFYNSIDKKKYINAGFLFFPNTMRNDELAKQMRKKLLESQPILFPEQDTISFLVENKKILPQKFNKMTITLYGTWWFSDLVFFKKDISEKNTMLHFPGNVKPFLNKRKISKLFLWGPKIQGQYNKVLERVDLIL